jgi:hypothetical protein
MRAAWRGAVPHSRRQHGFERAVAAPEMVVERRRGMKRDQAEEKEPDRRVRLPQLLGEGAVPADHRRQLPDETGPPGRRRRWSIGARGSRERAR